MLLYAVIDGLEQCTGSKVAFDLVAPHYDLLMSGVPYRFWVRYLHSLWDHHKHEPMSVLDLACGTGTISLILAQEGMAVTGVDIAAPMLRQAEVKSAKAGLFVSLEQQDAAELDLPGKQFDTIVSLFDSLNNIVEPDRLLRCFKRVKLHCLPNALFVFDLNTEYAFKQGMFNQKSNPLDGPLKYEWKSIYDEGTKLCTVFMNFKFKPKRKPSMAFKEIHYQRAYSTDEITSMLEEAGFINVSVYDAYTLFPAKGRSDRLFFTAATPGIAPD
jgi:ubiquinone/menaquinone biosynthesis C-methylase UbiE